MGPILRRAELVMGGLKAGEARELLRSTGPNAFVSARLVIGEWLHDGQYCFLTNEQHWDLITDFDITDPASHRLLLSTIVEIDEGYRIYAEMYRANGPIGQHKRNLKDLSKLAGRLLPLLEAEPLLWHFADYRWNVDIDALLDGLLKVRKAAKEL